MARDSMGKLIARVRQMIGDTDAANYAFDDDAVQAALDAHRFHAEYAALQPVAEYSAGGEAIYTTYRSGAAPWESDAVLMDGSYNALTPDDADWMNGEWTFNAGQAPPVLIRGKYYDLYAAAADLLEEWAARLARDYDFGTDGDSFKRSQMAASLREQAERYRARAWASVAEITG